METKQKFQTTRSTKVQQINNNFSTKADKGNTTVIIKKHIIIKNKRLHKQ